jgi:nucleoside 2-deoxyribosyltransferase
MKIYLASPFFSEHELEQVKIAENILEERGFTVFSPRKHQIPEEKQGSPAWSKAVFMADRTYIDWADVVVMLYHGQYSDSGTAWECGYAFGTHKPVLVVQLGTDSNLMVHEGSHANITMEELKTYDFARMPLQGYTGPMF